MDSIEHLFAHSTIAFIAVDCFCKEKRRREEDVSMFLSCSVEVAKRDPIKEQRNRDEESAKKCCSCSLGSVTWELSNLLLLLDDAQIKSKVDVSPQVRAEKPNPIIFHKACELLQVEPHEAIHVGDDRRNDVWGARDAGCATLHWGCDVFSFSEVRAPIL